MPILNYTTTVPAEKTVGEIIGILARKGADTVSQNYTAGEITGVSFLFNVGGVKVAFSLPANEEGVEKYMLTEAMSKLPAWKRDVTALPKERRESIRQQARRTAWRILKDWIEAQIALVESKQAEMGQVFMPYAIAGNGQTMYQLFVENNQKQLGAGGA